MRSALRILFWPARLLWWVTKPRHFPHGQPFDIRTPAVIDGDTLIHNGRRIRIWGIDAPEMSQPGGRAAKDNLIALCYRRHIHVVPRGTDVYGRMVAQLFSGRGDIGAAMVEGGFARASGGHYAKNERKARRAARGLWCEGMIEDPAIYRQRRSGLA